MKARSRSNRPQDPSRSLAFESLENRALLHGGSHGSGTAEPLADFSRPDINPSSATSAQSVSPRQFLNKVSAWYFGHAT